MKIGWGGGKNVRMKVRKRESLANDVRDFDWWGALERKCSVKKWGASGMKKLEEK